MEKKLVKNKDDKQKKSHAALNKVQNNKITFNALQLDKYSI
jgi:hypothetical protein